MAIVHQRLNTILIILICFNGLFLATTFENMVMTARPSPHVQIEMPRRSTTAKAHQLKQLTGFLTTVFSSYRNVVAQRLLSQVQTSRKDNFLEVIHQWREPE